MPVLSAAFSVDNVMPDEVSCRYARKVLIRSRAASRIRRIPSREH